MLDCDRADHIVKRDGTARNMYVALSGTLEARDGDRISADSRAFLVNLVAILARRLADTGSLAG